MERAAPLTANQLVHPEGLHPTRHRAATSKRAAPRNEQRHATGVVDEDITG